MFTLQQILTYDSCRCPRLSHTSEKQVLEMRTFFHVFLALTWPENVGLSLGSALCVCKVPILVTSPSW